MSETVLPVSTGQIKDIIATLIGGIPTDLTFDEAQSVIGAKGKLIEGVTMVFASLRQKGKIKVAPLARSDANSYRVVVPYRDKTTIKELLLAGKYDWVSDDITDENFPHVQRGDIEVNTRLVDLGQHISTDRALAKLARRKLWPATAAELLAFGAEYPDVQRQHPIVALGQTWCNSKGYDTVVCLVSCVGKRSAGLDYCVGDNWSRRCRFLAVAR